MGTTVLRTRVRRERRPSIRVRHCASSARDRGSGIHLRTRARPPPATIGSRPARRARHVCPEPSRLGCETREQGGARVEGLALQARPRADPAVERTGRKVRVALLAWRNAHGALEPHLAAKRVPMYDRSGTRIRVELATLPAVIVGVEHDIAGVHDQLLEEHHARRRASVDGRGCKHHCIGIGLDLARPRGLEPLREQRQGVGRQLGRQRVVAGQRRTRVVGGNYAPAENPAAHSSGIFAAGMAVTPIPLVKDPRRIRCRGR